MLKKETRNPVKTVIFDIGGVLVLPKNPTTIKLGKHPSSLGVHERIAKKLRISLDQWFDTIETTYVDAYLGKVSEQTTVLTLARKLQVHPGYLRWLVIKSYRKNFKQNKKLYRLAFKIKKQGYKIAVLSDQWWLSKEAMVKRKYMEKFDKVFISCDVGLRKPNPEIYGLALKKLKTPAQNCIFIDNQPWNLTPAKKLGMRTILFKDNKQLFEQLLKLGVEI
jgi:epoxide hydrolase-like predicted phosphatase